MRILFITQVVPLPVRGGESIRSMGLLKSLVQSGYEIVLIAPPQTDFRGLAERLEGVTGVPFDFGTPKASRVREFLDYFRRNPRLENRIAELIRLHDIRLGFIDYFFLGQYISLFRKAGIKVIYGTHNAQSQLRLQQPARGLIQKSTRLFAFLAQSWHERLYFKKADRLICVSEIDRNFYQQFIPSEQIAVIPNFIDESAYHPSTEKKPYIVMTGNFQSFQNHHGLEWFLENVWNEELAGMTTLYLLGNGASEALQSARQRRPFDGVMASGPTDDLLSAIARASAAIVPLWHGSGTRLKCIEAMALGTQLVSTSIGAEGIRHEGSIMIADTPREFREMIIRSIRGTIHTTAKAHQIFLERYSLAANRQKLNDLIRSLQ